MACSEITFFTVPATTGCHLGLHVSCALQVHKETGGDVLQQLFHWPGNQVHAAARRFEQFPKMYIYTGADSERSDSVKSAIYTNIWRKQADPVLLRPGAQYTCTHAFFAIRRPPFIEEERRKIYLF